MWCASHNTIFKKLAATLWLFVCCEFRYKKNSEWTPQNCGLEDEKKHIKPKPTRMQHAAATQDQNTKLHRRKKKPQMILDLFALCLGKLIEFVF